MKKSDIAIADEILSNAIRIERFTASEKKKLFKVFLQMQTELKAKLASGFTPYEKTRLTKLLKDCTAIINTFYVGIQSEFDFVGLAKAEAAATQTAIASIGLEASLPSAAVLKAMVSDSLIQGAPLKDWWEKMGADTAFKFAAQVRQGVVAGETLQQVIMRIVGSKKKGIVGIMEISHRHASTLVHDSIMQIANDARMATYKANADIMKGFEWLATLDGNTCIECMAYSGAQWDMEGNSIKGDLPLKNPPLHPNCLAGGTVISAAGVSKQYKRWFEGEVVVLSVTGIDDITITPNHPVLTEHGWVAAGLLKKGDRLVFCEDTTAVISLINPNNNHMETRIDEIGSSLLMAGGMFSSTMEVSTEDFHGDGIVDEKVDIILANSLLPYNGQPGISEQIKKETLSPGHRGRVFLDTNSAVAKFLIGGFTPSPGNIGGSSAGGSGVGTGSGGLQAVPLADTAGRQSEAPEPTKDKLVSTPHLSGDILERFAGHIGFVKLKDVTVRKYASHVYNLQSDFGWYVVNIAQPQYKSKGIIVHNCRCVLTSLTKSYRDLGLNVDEMPPGTRASDLGQVPADMSMDAFLKRHDTEYLNDLLGPGRAKLFQEGKITLRQLVDGTGRPLRLDELRKAA